MTEQLDTSTAAIAALLDGVTPGPWGISFRRDGTGYICMGSPHGGPHKQFDILLEKGYRNDERDAEFIGSARDLVPALSTELTALRAERDNWRNDYRTLESAVVGDTGLSAMLVATQAMLFKPRCEKAEAERDAALARVAVLELALAPCVKMLIELNVESGRAVEFGEEDAFRMGEWFEKDDIVAISIARTALAKGETL